MGKNGKTKQQYKKQMAKQAEYQANKQDKMEQRKTKREKKREKNKFNVGDASFNDALESKARVGHDQVQGAACLIWAESSGDGWRWKLSVPNAG